MKTISFAATHMNLVTILLSERDPQILCVLLVRNIKQLNSEKQRGNVINKC